jgi:hypothetical protein
VTELLDKCVIYLEESSLRVGSLLSGFPSRGCGCTATCDGIEFLDNTEKIYKLSICFDTVCLNILLSITECFNAVFLRISQISL